MEDLDLSAGLIEGELDLATFGEVKGWLRLAPLSGDEPFAITLQLLGHCAVPLRGKRLRLLQRDATRMDVAGVARVQRGGVDRLHYTRLSPGERKALLLSWNSDDGFVASLEIAAASVLELPVLGF